MPCRQTQAPPARMPSPATSPPPLCASRPGGQQSAGGLHARSRLPCHLPRCAQASRPAGQHGSRAPHLDALLRGRLVRAEDELLQLRLRHRPVDGAAPLQERHGQHLARRPAPVRARRAGLGLKSAGQGSKCGWLHLCLRLGVHLCHRPAPKVRWAGQAGFEGGGVSAGCCCRKDTGGTGGAPCVRAHHPHTTRWVGTVEERGVAGGFGGLPRARGSSARGNPKLTLTQTLSHAAQPRSTAPSPAPSRQLGAAPEMERHGRARAGQPHKTARMERRGHAWAGS